MKKHTLIIIVCLFAISIILTGWKFYDNKQNTAIALEKNEDTAVSLAQTKDTVSVMDILENPDFDTEQISILVRKLALEQPKIVLETKEQQKQFIDEFLALELKPISTPYFLEKASKISLTLNNELYNIFVYERKKYIFFFEDYYGTSSYEIINGDNFFELLNSYKYTE